MAAKYRIISTLFMLLFLGNTYIFSRAGVELEILPGFSGGFSAGYWIPLTVFIESDLPSFEGRLEVSVSLGSIHRADRGSYTVQRKLFVEPGVKQQMLFSIPVERREELTVRLFRDNEVLAVTRFPLNPYGHGRKTILILSRRADIGVPIEAGRFPISVHPETLPVSSEGYSSVAAVIIHDAPLNEISPRQLDALSEWIREGGALVVTGGIVSPDRLPTEFTALFPYNLHGRGEAAESPLIAGSIVHPLPAAAAYPLWIGERKKGSVPLLNTGPGVSFSTEAVKMEGRGWVAASLIDPASTPYREWAGLDYYWELLLSVKSEDGRIYPVSDPLPNLHSQLMSHMPAASVSFYITSVLFLFPYLVLIVAAFRTRRIRGWIILPVFLPFVVVFFMSVFLPDEKPVYREIALLKGDISSGYGDLLLKGGLTGRIGGDTSFKLEKGPFIVLPNTEESLVVSESPERIILNRERWGSREFFLGGAYDIPVTSELKRDDDGVSCFIRWKSGFSCRDAVLIGGESAVEQAVFLHEEGGLSFRAFLSEGSSALRAEAENTRKAAEKLSPAMRGYMDYLITNGLVPRDSGNDFYLLMFDDLTETVLNPEGTENIGLKAILLAVKTEELFDEK